MLHFLSKPPGHYKPLAILLTLTALLYSLLLQAQTADGNTGLNQANTMIRSYYEPATNLLYGIGAFMGLVGASKVFISTMNSNRSDVAAHAGVWFAGCLFLVIASTVIKAFFGM